MTTASLTSDPSPPSTGYRRIRGIDGEIVLAFVPLHDELFGHDMSCSAHRPVGKDDRVGRDAGQDELAVFDFGASRIEDRQRRHRAGRRDFADGLFERYVRLLRGVLRKGGGRQRETSGEDQRGDVRSIFMVMSSQMGQAGCPSPDEPLMSRAFVAPNSCRRIVLVLEDLSSSRLSCR